MCLTIISHQPVALIPPDNFAHPLFGYAKQLTQMSVADFRVLLVAFEEAKSMLSNLGHSNLLTGCGGMPGFQEHDTDQHRKRGGEFLFPLAEPALSGDKNLV